jgi:CRP-like cAMP-binding protein
LIRETKTKATIIDFLINIPLFDELKTNELETMADYMQSIKIEKDEILFNEGDKGDYVCFILDGTLEVIKESSLGERAVIATLSRGRSIGEMSVIDDFPRSATVRALTEAHLLTLTHKNFQKILKENPLIGIKLLKKISRLLSLNLRQTSSRLTESILSLS